MKPGRAIAVLALVAATAVGCGDGDGGGRDEPATVEEFCGAFETFYEEVGRSAEDPDLGRVLKDAAEQVGEVGTPEDIPDDAREGFELTLQTIGDLPDEATEEDVAGSQQGYSQDDQEKVRAFNDYLAQTCPGLGTG